MQFLVARDRNAGYSIFDKVYAIVAKIRTRTLFNASLPLVKFARSLILQNRIDARFSPFLLPT